MRLLSRSRGRPESLFVTPFTPVLCFRRDDGPCIVPELRLQVRLTSRRLPVRTALLRALAALAIVTTFGLAPAAAQTGQMFGELVGKVTDDQGGVLPGVTVTLSGPAVMGAPTAVTERNGTVSVPRCQLGHLHA